MPKPNYQFEKRQRELAKKAKKAEKAARKTAGGRSDGADDAPVDEALPPAEDASGGAGDPATPAGSQT